MMTRRIGLIAAVFSAALVVPALVAADTSKTTTKTKTVEETVPANSADAAADNTKKNVRDKDNATLTPLDQADGSPSDVDVTRRIRKALNQDKSLSTNAKNVKIITLNGKTTLRGPVETDGERERIIKQATQVAGAKNVTSELEVKHP